MECCIANRSRSAVAGGGDVRVFHEQLGRSLLKNTVVSIGDGEPLQDKLLLRTVMKASSLCGRSETIRQTDAYHHEPESVSGTDPVEPTIFCLGLKLTPTQSRIDSM